VSDLRLTFTDPATRRTVTLDAQRAPQTADKKDGFVDLGLDGFDDAVRIPAGDLNSTQTAALKRALANPDLAGLKIEDRLAGSTAAVMVRTSDLGSEIDDHIAPALPGANLDATGARRPVSFTGGRFSAELGSKPQSNPAIGEGLYAAAKLIDDAPGNAIDAMALNGTQRNDLLKNVQTDLKAAAVGETAEGLSDKQTLQMRSSASTVLLELITAKDTKPELQKAGLTTYIETMQAEKNPVLRDSMGWNLLRTAHTLPQELHQSIGEGLAPVRSEYPPYDQWFKDGDNTVTVDWSAGTESLGDDKKRLLKEGFTKVGNEGGGTIYEKTYDVNGEQTQFRVRMRAFRSDMYQRVDDPDTDMVIYTGHSNWGRNMRDSLKDVDNENGGTGKLELNDLCVGKGEMQQFKDKFPNADLVTTHNSSYFIPGTATREASSEGINTILTTFDGIANRAAYSDIAEGVRRANPWGSDHQRDGVDNNFIFPGDEIVRRRVLDRDHDGQADILDRVVDFNSFAPQTDAARDFEAIKGRPADIQDGTKAHFAAMTVTRLGVYSQELGKYTKDGRVTPDGLFDPKPDETNMFRFAQGEIEGRPSITMKMNAHHTHASEEALRAAASYEFARFVQGDEGDPLDNRLNALVFASHSLHTDAGGRDGQIWDALLKAKGLPEIDRRSVESAKNSDHDHYSGSHKATKALREKLDETTLEALLETP
jgi:hypothetical protein